MEYAILVVLHLLFALIWVGGMFYAVLIQHYAIQFLEAPKKIEYLVGALSRFFKWVWLSSIIVILSGWRLYMIIKAGGGDIQWHIHLMLSIGNIMFVIFVILYIFFFQKLKKAFLNKEFPIAAAILKKMRLIIITNLILGLTLVISGALGRYIN